MLNSNVKEFGPIRRIGSLIYNVFKKPVYPKKVTTRNVHKYHGQQGNLPPSYVPVGLVYEFPVDSPFSPYKSYEEKYQRPYRTKLNDEELVKFYEKVYARYIKQSVPELDFTFDLGFGAVF